MPQRPKIVVNPPSTPVHPIPAGMIDAIHHGDCVSHLQSLPEACVPLAFADPPFNIGYDYDVYDDSLEAEKYLSWCQAWISELYRVLIPTGTFWLAIGDEYAAELKILSQKAGFHCRSWVVWYYTFGVHCKSKFTRSHAHLFHFVKDPNRFTFHADAVAVPSARQLVYADARANPKGRIPDDTWILRPQDCFEGLKPNEDTWYFPRVSGTFKERAGFHGCQMPEQLLGRIIRSCSNPEDVVLDPFSGSATTLAVAKKLGRHFLGFDLSQEYIALGTQRLARIAVGQPLEGAEDPKASAPATHQGKQRGAKSPLKPRSKSKGATESLPLFDLVANQDELLLEAFDASHRGASVDRLVVDPILNEDFQRACDRLKIEGTQEQRNRSLLRLRKLGRTLHFDFDLEQKVAPKWSELDLYLFASEIAWRRVADRYAVDLVELFCDVRLAAQFDAMAARYSPGFTSLEYRWGALMLQEAIRSVPNLDSDRDWDAELGLEGWDSVQAISLANSHSQPFPESPAVYSLEDLAAGQVLYVGETANLSLRIERQFGEGRLSTLYDTSLERASIRFRTIPCDPSRNQWRRARLIDRSLTTWNV